MIHSYIPKKIPNPDTWFSTQSPWWAAAQAKAKAILEELQTEIDKIHKREKAIWPPLEEARLRWEFLRRSSVYQACCNNLLALREESVPRRRTESDGSEYVGAGGAYGHIREELRDFEFIWGLNIQSIESPGLLCLCYWQGFETILSMIIATGRTILLPNQEYIHRLAETWFNDPLSSGYPAPDLECALESGCTEMTPDRITWSNRWRYSFPKTDGDIKSFFKTLQEAKVPVCEVHHDGKFWHVYISRTVSIFNAWNDDDFDAIMYDKMQAALEKHFGTTLTPFKPKIRMQAREELGSTAGLQLIAIDVAQGHTTWEDHPDKRLEANRRKELKDSAFNKLAKIEATARSRKNTIKASKSRPFFPET